MQYAEKFAEQLLDELFGFAHNWRQTLLQALWTFLGRNRKQLVCAGYEMDSIFMAISSIACSLDPCPSRSVKAAQGVLSEWVLVVVNSSFTERVVSLLIKESSQEAITRPYHARQFSSGN